MVTTLEEQQPTEALRSASSDEPVWIRVGHLLDGTGAVPLANAHLVYDAAGIRYVGAADEPPPRGVLAPNAQAPDAELAGYTVLPGLVEGHAHLFLDGAPVDFEARTAYLKQSPEWMLARARERLKKIVCTGVMAVRDAGDNRGVGLALQETYFAGSRNASVMPYIDSPGAAIHHKGRYGSFMSEPIENFADPDACVEARCNAGAARIKLIATGIINFNKGAVTKPPQMSAEEVAALVAAAKQRGKQTLAHASGADGVENVIEGGITTVEHGFFVTPEQLAKMRDRSIAWTPTFAPVQIQIDRASEMGWNDNVVAGLARIIEGHKASLLRAQEMGVTIIAGSDAGSCGVPHGLGFLTELELMEHAGMPPLAIINAATGVSAGFLQLTEPVGRLAPGHRARMIFTRHSPVTTVSNLRKEKTLVFDGRVIADDGAIDPDGL